MSQSDCSDTTRTTWQDMEEHRAREAWRTVSPDTAEEGHSAAFSEPVPLLLQGALQVRISHHHLISFSFLRISCIL